MNPFFMFRPTKPDELPPLPISVKMSGFHTAPQDWEEYNPGTHRLHCGLFWAEHGHATLNIAGTDHAFVQGDCMVYFPHESHHLTVLSESFSYYWFTFDGPLASTLLKAFQFPPSPLHAGPPPEEIFRALRMNMMNYSPVARYRDSAIAYQLLSKAKSPEHTPPPVSMTSTLQIVQHFKQLVEETYMFKETNLNSLAKELGRHRTTITRLLKEHVGLTPEKYLNNVRLQKALQLLKQTTLSAAEISEQCGFATPNYFSLKVKQLTGMPPHRFRAER